jgi:hypothetical protein
MTRERTRRASTLTRRSLLVGAAVAARMPSAPGLAAAASPEPTALQWKPMVAPPPGLPVLNGHTDTMLDVVGRIGAPIDLAIFTEGNHFPALFGGDILPPFRAWAARDARFAAIDLSNIVVVALPQPMIVAMLLNGGIVTGNLTLAVSRAGGFFPDIVMGGAAPLKRLHAAGIVEPTARVFAKIRGMSLLVRQGNPASIAGAGDLARSDLRVVLAGPDEPGARAQYRQALAAMLGKDVADAVLAREIGSFAGRLHVQHRDVPYAVAAGLADVGIVFHHHARYYAATYPEIFAMVDTPGAEQSFSTIATGLAVDPPRAAAARAFAEYFFSVADTVYPACGFAPMRPGDYGAAIAL